MATATETFHDHDLIGDVEKAEVVHNETIQHGHLTAEELEIEKHLRRKIDWRIMPLVILVYLMNYIDRYARPMCRENALITAGTIMLPQSSRAWWRIYISSVISIKSG
jgi:hypothetical protein